MMLVQKPTTLWTAPVDSGEQIELIKTVPCACARLCVHVLGFVSAMLCTTSWVQDYVVHHLVGTGLCCAPPTCVVHQPTCVVHQGTQIYTRGTYVRQMWGLPLTFSILCHTKYGQNVLMDIGPPCAPWCTTQVDGAQCSLYSRGGARHRSHKLTGTHTHMNSILLPGISSLVTGGTDT